MHAISNTVNRKFINSVDLEDLEIETDSGWQPVNSIHKTVPYDVWYVETKSGFSLECADDHIVFDQDHSEIYVKDIVAGVTEIQTKLGADLVINVYKKNQKENMYDIAVDHSDHRYYTNNILSHNTCIVNAISYAIYGQALTNIKRENLINKTNAKNMLVTVEFEKDGQSYKIERGRRPNVLRFYIGGAEQAPTDDNAQGDSRETQADIERLFGMSLDMFKHTVALNTYTEPFLSMRSNDQRAVIEQLLGITQLSSKAETLKDQLKTTKSLLTEEEYRIRAVHDSNKRIQEQIAGLQRRQRLWQNKHNEDLAELQAALDQLSKINIDEEIANHNLLVELKQQQDRHNEAERWLRNIQADNQRLLKDQSRLQTELASIEQHRCHSCGQEIHDNKQEEIKVSLQDSLQRVALQLATNSTQEQEHLEIIASTRELQSPPATVYSDLAQALEHRSNLAGIQDQITRLLNEADPYQEQIEEMQQGGLQTVDYTVINDLKRMQDHQEFLLKLLTNKDSFIRKRIIDQNLTFLNARLKYYLQQLGLPHTVEFKNDLTVEIQDLGRDLDFDNLSRGERNRLILSLSWGFRDVWENLYQPINLLFVDELIDSGMDSSGVENALSVLKGMSRERQKSVWLISHRDELAGRVNNILWVIKEGGFTNFSSDVETA